MIRWKESDFEDNVLPEGEFELTIIKAEEKDSKQGNPMLRLVLESNEGNIIYHIIPLRTQQGNFLLKEFLLGLGIRDNEGSLSTDELRGATINAALEIEDYEGEHGKHKRNKISKIIERTLKDGYEE